MQIDVSNIWNLRVRVNQKIVVLGSFISSPAIRVDLSLLKSGVNVHKASGLLLVSIFDTRRDVFFYLTCERG